MQKPVACWFTSLGRNPALPEDVKSRALNSCSFMMEMIEPEAGSTVRMRPQVGVGVGSQRRLAHGQKGAEASSRSETTRSLHTV